MRAFEVLLEAKDIIDLRHGETTKDIPIWPRESEGTYIPKSAGFYFIYSDGKIVVFSTDNEYYSFLAHHYEKASPDEQAIAKKDIRAFHKIDRIKNAHNEISSVWNQLGGKVDYSLQEITIAKESAGDKMRQRVISDIDAFKSALRSLKDTREGFGDLGVTDDYIIKGAPPNLPKPKGSKYPTVGSVLTGMSSYVQDIVQQKDDLIMYHGTSEARWEIIQRTGLRPGQVGEVYNDLIPGYSEFNVYLATTPKAAQFYARRQAKKDDSKSIVLQVKVPDPVKLIADDRFAWWGGEIEGHRIDRIKDSIKELGELAYKGWIPPKFIKKK